MESTPPLTKKKTLRSPATVRGSGLRRIATWPAGSQSLHAAADVEQEISQNRQAAGRVRDFGMKLDARTGGARARTMAAMAQVAVLARTSKPVGRCGDHVAMAHPDLLAAFNAVEDRCRDAMMSSWARPYSPLSPLWTMAPERRGPSIAGRSRCRARGCRSVSRAGIDGGAGGVVNAGRSAGDDDAFPAAQGWRREFRWARLRRRCPGRGPFARSDDSTVRLRRGR